MLNGGFVGLAVGAGRLFAVAARKFGVSQPVQGRDLAGGVRGDSGAHAGCFKHGHRLACPLEGQRSGQAGDAATYHGHVNVEGTMQVLIEGGVLHRSAGGRPQGTKPACKLITHGPRLSRPGLPPGSQCPAVFAALAAALAACLLARTLVSDSGSTMSATDRYESCWP
ncbi:hypothetical protein D9M72_415720 [compost metagenome]